MLDRYVPACPDPREEPQCADRLQNDDADVGASGAGGHDHETDREEKSKKTGHW